MKEHKKTERVLSAQTLSMRILSARISSAQVQCSRVLSTLILPALALLIAVSLLAGCSAALTNGKTTTAPAAGSSSSADTMKPGNTTSSAPDKTQGSSPGSPDTPEPEEPQEQKPDLTAAKPGDVIHFGQNDWRVLALKDGKALIIIETLTENGQYDYEGINKWDYSIIREYLNNVFITNAFDDADRAKICETNVITGANPWNEEVSGGNDTRDKLFLLSLEELVLYFGDSGQLAVKPDNVETDEFDDMYNEARIAHIAAGNARGWWLRSPGDRPNYVAFVDFDGSVSVNGTSTMGRHYLRPALWLKLDGPALAGDHDPVINHLPHTYTTKNKAFTVDIPYGLEITYKEHSSGGDYIRIDSVRDKWTIHFYEHVPKGNGSSADTYYAQKDVIENAVNYETWPIMIAGKEGMYYLNPSSGIHIVIAFTDPTSDSKNAIWGVIWLIMDPIEGYETEDYFEIPEVKAIIDSIRAPGQ